MIFDMGTAAVNHGDLVLASWLGRELPEGVALDAQGGRPATPPRRLPARSCRLGHKGHGLSFAIQALGLLGGAALPRGQVQDYGYLFVVFDPGLLMPAGEFQRQLDELVSRVKSVRRQPGAGEIRIPSERAYAERERRLAEASRSSACFTTGSAP